MNLYLKFFSIHLKGQMQYKMSFFLTLFGQFIGAFSSYLALYFMMNRFHTVDQYTFNEIIILFAVMMFSFSLAECFMRGFDQFPTMISNGEFDRMLLRPKNIIFQIMAAKIDFTRLGKLVQAIIVLAYAMPTSGIIWSADKIITLILMISGGVVIFSGMFIIYAALSFYTLEGLEFINLFTNGGLEFGKYPVSIYGKRLMQVFTFIIPYTLFQYYPFLYVIGHSENSMYAIMPVGTLIFLLPCYILWKIGLKHYTSTGS